MILTRGRTIETTVVTEQGKRKYISSIHFHAIKTNVLFEDHMAYPSYR